MGDIVSLTTDGDHRMVRAILTFLFMALASTSTLAQEHAAAPSEALRFEDVVDNLDKTKNTDLHVKEYWKSVKGQEMSSSGTLLEAKPKMFGKGATISLLNESRVAIKDVNIVLEIDNVASAANLKPNDTITFSGSLKSYQGGEGKGTRLTLDKAEILERTPGVAKPKTEPKPEPTAKPSQPKNPTPPAEKADRAAKAEKAEKPAKPKSSAPNFIPAPGLSGAKISQLWSVAKSTCYDVGYVITNDDQSSRNLVCSQQIDDGRTLTLRVKFAPDGIYIESRSSDFTFNLLGLGAKSKEVKMMREALAAKL